MGTPEACLSFPHCLPGGSLTSDLGHCNPLLPGAVLCFFRLDTKSLERASMDYEAPLMPCGCILPPPPTSHPRHWLYAQSPGRGQGLCGLLAGPEVGSGPQLLPWGFSQATAKAAGAHAGKLRGGWESSRVLGNTGCCWDRGVPGPAPLVG